MTRSTDSREKRLSELKREVNKRGFDRHASVLRYVSELPIDLRSPALMIMIDGEVIQSVIVFPPQIQRGWDYIPKQALLFTPAGVIHLLASIWSDHEPTITYVKSCDIMYMKVKLVLLYGSLEIVARGQESPIRLNVEFNTVAWRCLSQPLRKLLLGAKVAPDSPKDIFVSSSATQRERKGLPLKFSNGLDIYGLLPGERLEELVFQTSLRKRRLLFFRQNVIANTLLFLSTNYMVTIQDDLDVEQGWIISHIPRDCITGIQNLPRGITNDLFVRLERGDQTADYQLSLRPESAEAWGSRWIQHGGQWRSFGNKRDEMNESVQD